MFHEMVVATIRGDPEWTNRTQQTGMPEGLQR